MRLFRRPSKCEGFWLVLTDRKNALHHVLSFHCGDTEPGHLPGSWLLVSCRDDQEDDHRDQNGPENQSRIQNVRPL